MARYFKFHSLDDLQAECGRLGLDLRFSTDLSPLFRPVQVGPLRAGNWRDYPELPASLPLI